MANLNRLESMNIVIVGHVDHGKSTIIGRLLAETGSLPVGKLEQVKERCKRNSKPFEYSFLLDALKDEQAQGITIDAARCFFKTQKREYIIIDAPGHIEFLKNMVTGASRADAALLVIDANEGIQENSKRHGYILSMLGIKQVAVVVNKMDLINYDEDKFNQIQKDYTKFLGEIGITPNSFIPVSGFEGDNIAESSSNTSWYKGLTILDLLDSFKVSALPDNADFRMPVQDVYKFTKNGDDRRIIAGNVETGTLKVGDEVIFYPSGKSSKVKSIEAFNKVEHDTIGSGYATGFTLEKQIYITRGELVAIAGEKNPEVSTRIKTNLFWLGKNSMVKNKKYFIKIGTQKVGCYIEDVTRVIDASTLSTLKKDQVDRHDVAELIIRTEKPVAFDTASDNAGTSRFVIIDNYDIAGGGIVNEALDDENSVIRDQVILRNYNWEGSSVSREEKAEIFNHKPALIILTGEAGTGRRDIAKSLEQTLLYRGKKAYYLGIENLNYGLDADLKDDNQKDERVRRFAETAHLMIDSGTILISTIVNLSKKELDLLKTIVSPEHIKTVLVGDDNGQDIKYSYHLEEHNTPEQGANIIKEFLKDEKLIFGF